ncbi:glycosyltransferase [Flavobacterium lacisediminis]|uniref:Glycosyltransferase n=1 Tax=Flavobacterium lacisediminis TaxID=2989705 RepID=A0ABT3EGW1_9FLAO|nr:glycosyltransferase [Flavobacterium lacisediminis]MCW1147829.1 glycosyltransferase [Flavobacterium lacisediminis]
MRICIITHVQHIKSDNQYFGYAPYIREMNIWFKYVDEVQVVAPLVEGPINPIHEKYIHSKLQFIDVLEFEITSLQNIIKTIFKLPILFKVVYIAMAQADHIHLRCPGNMGLIGALVQILFPNKQKTAKYAGNWDPKSKQPWSYRLQKWILSNTFLTRNMQVLVYGKWEGSTKNIKSFFTATYSENEVRNSSCEIRSVNNEVIKFLFVGTLSKGKQPLYVIQLVEELNKRGEKVILELYGEGVLRKELELYIAQNNLESIVTLKGNQTKETVLKGYQNSHFLILPSKSEGWPKVVAEAMFWGCVPIASPVSCVPYMMGNGNRGVILKEELNQDISKITTIINNQELYQKMATDGQVWSRQFTTDKFETEISKLLKE